MCYSLTLNLYFIRITGLYGEHVTVEPKTQVLSDLALRFGKADEESMVITATFLFLNIFLCNINSAIEYQNAHMHT